MVKAPKRTTRCPESGDLATLRSENELTESQSTYDKFTLPDPIAHMKLPEQNYDEDLPPIVPNFDGNEYDDMPESYSPDVLQEVDPMDQFEQLVPEEREDDRHQSMDRTNIMA